MIIHPTRRHPWNNRGGHRLCVQTRRILKTRPCRLLHTPHTHPITLSRGSSQLGHGRRRSILNPSPPKCPFLRVPRHLPLSLPQKLATSPPAAQTFPRNLGTRLVNPPFPHKPRRHQGKPQYRPPLARHPTVWIFPR